MFKEFLIKKMLQHKLKDARLNDGVGQVPKDQQEKVIEMFQKNPQLFETIAKEIQQKTSNGKDQMSAAIEVVAKYKDQLQAIK